MKTTHHTHARGHRARRAVAGVVAAAVITGLLASGAHAATAYTTAPLPPSPWTPLALTSLNVTSGAIAAVKPNYTLATVDPVVRAVHKDGGRHHSSARLWFKYYGPSAGEQKLDNGDLRRQIGLKLRHRDPCNVVYVMWHIAPTSQIQIVVKRNPTMTTSNDCGSAGYGKPVNIPIAPAGTGAHWLAARTRRLPSGELALSVYADNGTTPVYTGNLGAAATQGLEGPIGVRSDNGHFAFQLSSQP